MINFGLAYRIYFKKVILVPSIEIGTYSLELDSREILLKEKNSNKITELKYTNNKSYSPDFFNTTLGFSVVYPIFKKLFVSANCSFYHFKSTAIYTEEITNLISLEKQTQTFDYQKNIYGMTLGLGLIWQPKISTRAVEKITRFK